MMYCWHDRDRFSAVYKYNEIYFAVCIGYVYVWKATRTGIIITIIIIIIIIMTFFNNVLVLNPIHSL
jgi:hypothetical protein